MCFFSEYQQTIRAVNKAIKSVVAILVFKKPEQLEGKVDSELIASLPTNKDGLIQVSNCSGFFISSEGLILTNRHVIDEEGAQYEVVWQHHHYDCDILVKDEATDIAILKINAKNTPYLKLGDSDKLKLGQTVIAIGNALSEFENTVSRGIISGLSRKIETDLEDKNKKFSGLIQTDAAINPGNSGGPLIDLKGRAIGINMATVLGVENIGFAIPINQAKRILRDYQKYGKFYRPSLGIRYLIVTPQLKEEHHLNSDYGAFIIFESIPGQKGIVPNGLAQKAGLKEGDIILAINNRKIINQDSISEILNDLHYGDEIKITFLRGKETKTAAIILKN
jgi:serine protease Do